MTDCGFTARVTWTGGIFASFAALWLAFPSATSADTAGEFDHYVLSLSWSPSYCASEAGADNTQQCGKSRLFSFIVHGLWPQYADGWPDYCDTDTRYVPEDVIDEMLDIIPSRGLVIHQWRKHGSCSGHGPGEYFALARDAFERVRIPARYVTPANEIVTSPAALEHDFLSTNLWLSEEMFTVHCGNTRDRGNLREVRICFTRELEPTACGANESRQCRADELVMPPVR